MRKILITGANGFIAKNISRVLKEAGFFIVGTSRVPKPIPNYNEIFQGVLGEPLKDVYEKHKIDVIIHCAYDKDDIENIKNTEGTLIWSEQAEKSDVELQIFMSSISASEDAISSYGQKKFELEKWFMAHNQVVFRLGLVVGNGGLFQTIISMVKKSPIIPLIDRGKTLTYLSDIDTICKIVRDCIVNPDKIQKGKIWCLQQESPDFFVDVLKEIRKQYNFFCIFIPIPYFVVSFLFNLTEKFKFLRLGINTNNLKGMRQFNQKKFKSDLKPLGYPEIPLEFLIKKLRIR